MRRRWMWIALGAMALALATFLTLALLRPETSFRFLEGQAPLPIQSRLVDLSELVYSWKPGDLQALAERANQELLSKGFDFPVSDLYVRDSGGEYNDIVYVLLNQRASRDGTYTDAEGWITVFVNLSEPGNLWDRIKAVFGL